MAVGTAVNYSNVVAFLATAGVIAPLVKRLKISPILGFLAAGVVLGPQGLGRFVPQTPWLDFLTVSKPEQVADFAELGVVFLLFTIGLELSWERLRLMRRQVFGLGLLQTLLAGVAIAGAALLLGVSAPAAAAVGAALAMSSTAIVLPVMAERGRLHAASGRSVFAVLLFQDIAVAPILIVLALAGGKPTGDVGAALALAEAAVGIVAMVAAGRLLLRPLFRSAAKAESQELFMAASLLVVIGAGIAAQLLGLSMALGAFVAGLMLAETEYRRQIEVMVSPFKDLLLGLFFVSVGLNLNIALLMASPGLILAAAVGLVLVKAVLGVGLARLFGLKGGSALESALMLASGGEFAFVILAQGRVSGLVPRELSQAMVVSVTLSMFLIPVLGALAARFGRSDGASAGAAPLPLEQEDRPRVILIGYGRVGRMVGEMLDRHGLPWLAVERDARAVEAARRTGAPVDFGDASRPELLERFGLRSALGVVLTTDEPEAAEEVTAAVRRVRPDVVLVARAQDERHARRLYELGATDAVPETIEASLQLSEAALVHLGAPMGPVIASIHEKRDEIRRSLGDAKGSEPSFSRPGAAARFNALAAQSGAPEAAEPAVTPEPERS
jgi:CPA2 family monovalent cation:H+ antiporter-2